MTPAPDPIGDQFPVMVQSMRFCGVRESFGTGVQQVKLPSQFITFRVDDDLPGMSRADFEASCWEGWQLWVRHIGIKVDKHANPKTDPTQIVTTRRFDGPGKVLADQELPYRGDGLLMRVDTSERWNQTVNLIPVLCHEDGHCLGMMHIEPMGTPDLMNATYSPAIQVPQEDDISYGRKLYGPPIAAPEPQPEDETHEWSFTTGGATYRVALTDKATTLAAVIEATRDGQSVRLSGEKGYSG